MSFFAIMKKFGLMDVHPISNMKFTGVTLATFLFCLNLRKIKLFVNHMNLKHKNIKFTFEAEDLNSFSFLDVKITCKNNRFVISTFCKATFSGVFTNYDSFIFNTKEVGLFHTLLFRFVKICFSM